MKLIDKIFMNDDGYHLVEKVLLVSDVEKTVEKLLEILEDPNIIAGDYMISKNAVVRIVKEQFALHENDGVKNG